MGNLNYKNIINSLNIVICQYDKKSNILKFSGNYKKVFKIKNNIKCFNDLYSIISSNYAEYIESFFSEAIENELEGTFLLEFVVVNNTKINIEFSGRGIKIDGKYMIVGTCIDITEKVKQESKLRINEKRYRRALEGSKDIMFYINLEKKVITLNNKISKLIGLDWKSEYKFSIDEWLDYVVYDERESLKEEFYRLILDKDKKYLDMVYRIKNKLGRVLWIHIKGKKVCEEEGEFIYGSINDETDRKEKELKINYMSYYDEVTGVPNRRYFKKYSQKMKDSSLLNKKVFALIFIDLDDFKYVNDTYGHAAGDIILKLFCEKINKRIDRKYCLSRFGGDEFVLALDNLSNEDEAIKIVKDILEECNIPMRINNKEIYNTVSIGISTCLSEGETIEDLLTKADIAMYKAKSTGKNKFTLFNKEMSKERDRELELGRCIRKSIENNEIYFLMQPKYWINSGKIQGFEVLARWNSEELGNVSPSEFIPISENNGFIIEIGKLLIKDSFKKCKILKEKIGYEFKVAINLSEIQIRDEGLVDFIKECIESEGVDTKNIEFEVTETVIMTSLNNNVKVLKDLKALGFSISLDDFGTGYSSLNYLRKLPIDTVKIDKSFIDDISKDFKDECVIKKIVELAHLLDIKVIAEGVENKEQVKFLNSINCDVIQGYYYSEPKTFNEILELIR